MDNLDEKFMNEALLQAQKAFEEDEVPIGCVIVKNDKIIGKGHNTVEQDKSAISHAEINAIQEASKYIGDWRLSDCTMYITLEPCAMCAGAIMRSRLKKLVIALRDPKRGCAGSIFNLVDDNRFNHRVEIEDGILEEASKEFLQTFFQEKRNSRDIDE